LRSRGFISKRDVPAPGAGLKTELRWLGGRASIARGGPKCRRKQTANNYTMILLELPPVPKRKMSSATMQAMYFQRFKAALEKTHEMNRLGQDCTRNGLVFQFGISKGA
jgi:hypothetical protein